MGQWMNNEMSGTGTFTWNDGRRYVGSYVNDEKDDHGVFTWPDGREYNGQWKEGRQHGTGVFKTARGDFREGEWQDGQRMRWIAEAYRGDGQAAAGENGTSADPESPPRARDFFVG